MLIADVPLYIADFAALIHRAVAYILLGKLLCSIIIYTSTLVQLRVFMKV